MPLIKQATQTFSWWGPKQSHSFDIMVPRGSQNGLVAEFTPHVFDPMMNTPNRNYVEFWPLNGGISVYYIPISGVEVVELSDAQFAAVKPHLPIMSTYALQLHLVVGRWTVVIASQPIMAGHMIGRNPSASTPVPVTPRKIGKGFRSFSCE